MYSVTLSGLRFHAPIGLYPEEQILGNEIEINIELSRYLPLNASPLLDYSKVYELVAAEAKEKDTLLENLMQRIINKITFVFPNTGIQLEIRKINPPFGGQADFASIRYDSSNSGKNS